MIVCLLYLTVGEKMDKLEINQKYCVKRHMFFAVTNPIIETDLNKAEAEKLANQLNSEELDSNYVTYLIHKING